MKSLQNIFSVFLCFLVVSFVSSSFDGDDLAFDQEVKAENDLIPSPRRGGGGSRGGGFRGGGYRYSGGHRYSGGGSSGNNGNTAKPCYFMTSLSIFAVIFAVLYSTTRLI